MSRGCSSVTGHTNRKVVEDLAEALLLRLKTPSTAHMCDWSSSTTAFQASVVIFWIFSVLQATGFVLHIRRGAKRQTVVTCMACLLASTVFRSVWFSIGVCRRLNEDEYFVQYVLNRIALLLLFSGFVVYLETWATFAYQTSSFQQLMKLPIDVYNRRVKRAVLFLNCFMWLAVFALSVGTLADFRGNRSKSCPKCVEACIILIGVMLLVLAALFLVAAIKVYSSLMGVAAGVVEESGERARMAARKAIGVGSICFANFLLGTIFWLWQPVQGERAPKWSYPLFFYTIIELLPTNLLFLILAPKVDTAREMSESSSYLTDYGGMGNDDRVALKVEEGANERKIIPHMSVATADESFAANTQESHSVYFQPSIGSSMSTSQAELPGHKDSTVGRGTAMSPRAATST